MHRHVERCRVAARLSAGACRPSVRSRHRRCRVNSFRLWSTFRPGQRWTGDAGTNGRGASSMSLEFALRPRRSKASSVLPIASSERNPSNVPRPLSGRPAPPGSRTTHTPAVPCRIPAPEASAARRPHHGVLARFTHRRSWPRDVGDRLHHRLDELIVRGSSPTIDTCWHSAAGERPRRGKTGLWRSAFRSQGRVRRSPRAALHRCHGSSTVLEVARVAD